MYICNEKITATPSNIWCCINTAATRNWFYSCATKRKRTSTGQSDSEQRSVFMLSNSDDKLNLIFDELVCIRKIQETTNKDICLFRTVL